MRNRAIGTYRKRFLFSWHQGFSVLPVCSSALRSLALLFLALPALGQSAHAGLKKWNVNVSNPTGNWSEDSRWMPPGVPDCDDDVVLPKLPAGGAPYYVMVDIDTACAATLYIKRDACLEIRDNKQLSVNRVKIMASSTSDCAAISLDMNSLLLLRGGGTSIINGNITVEMDATIQITGADHTLQGQGRIHGRDERSMIIIDDNLLLTNRAHIDGAGHITGCRFMNDGGGGVHATNCGQKKGTILIDPMILEAGAGEFRVSGDEKAALDLRCECQTLSGDFVVNNGALNVFGNIWTSGSLTFTSGQIAVSQGVSFRTNQ